MKSGQSSEKDTQRMTFILPMKWAFSKMQPPQQTFKFKGEKCTGNKFSKNGLTALVFSNMSDTHKKRTVGY